MVIDLNDAKLATREQLRGFLAGAVDLNLTPTADPAAHYGFIKGVLKRFKYPLQSKGHRGLIRRYLQRVTGYSRPGRGFESCSARHQFKSLQQCRPLFVCAIPTVFPASPRFRAARRFGVHHRDHLIPQGVRGRFNTDRDVAAAFSPHEPKHCRVPTACRMLPDRPSSTKPTTSRCGRFQDAGKAMARRTWAAPPVRGIGPIHERTT